MKIKKITDEIDRIAKIESPKQTQEEVRELDQQIKAPKIAIRLRGKYAYCYVYELVYRPEVRSTRREYIEKIGRISKDIYLKNEKEIKAMSYEELKKYEYLEQY